MNSPTLSFRNATSPYAALSVPVTYSETVAKQTGLPVLSGDSSDVIAFRLYNNFSTPPASSIATAYNIQLTTYDSSSVLTASTSPVSNMWVYFQESGYGEQSSISGLLYAYAGTDTAVGGTVNTYSPEKGSDGSAASITANTTNASTSVTGMSSQTGILLGMQVTGTGITPGTTVFALPTSTTMILSLPATATNTGKAMGFYATPLASSYARAGTGNAGVGFIEFKTHANVPLSVSTKSYTFALTAIFDWNT